MPNADVRKEIRIRRFAICNRDSKKRMMKKEYVKTLPHLGGMSKTKG
jgi:hypothetical protein